MSSVLPQSFIENIPDEEKPQRLLGWRQSRNFQCLAYKPGAWAPLRRAWFHKGMIDREHPLQVIKRPRHGICNI